MTNDMDNPPIRVLSLFTGAGGLEVATKLAGGFKTVAYVEYEKYAQDVLVQRIQDGVLDRAPIWPDVRTFDAKPWRGSVDVVVGGFPCQDVSQAGKRTGLKEGNRSGLWSEYARIICEVEPKFVLIENVRGLLSSHNVYCEFCRFGVGWKAKDIPKVRKEDEPWTDEKTDTRPVCSGCGLLVDHEHTRYVYGFGRVLADLARLGFDARWYVLSAVAVGARHRRDRVWVVAWRRERERERVATWPTPNCSDTYTANLKSGQMNGTRKSVTLARAVNQWPTPRANDAEKRGAIANDPRNGLPSAALWATPGARDSKGQDAKNRRGGGESLPTSQELWATPQARDFRTGQAKRWDNPKRSRNLNDQVAKKKRDE